MTSTSAPRATGSAAPKPALVVAGMHRSGTSAMARVLALAGAALPERVIPSGPDNPLGFWEPWEMVALNDDILKAAGSAWDDVFVDQADSRAWDQRDAFLAPAGAFLLQNYGARALPVIKDPRASVLARLWRAALEAGGHKPVYLVMVRHPLEVAGSLRARDGFPIEKGLLLWTAYMMAVERDTRGADRVFIAYDDLLDDWSGVLDRVERAVGAPLPGRTAAVADIAAYLSRSHRHHDAGAGGAADLGDSPVGVVHAWMKTAATGLEPDPAVMDAAAGAMSAQARLWQPVIEDQARRAADRLIRAETAIADSEARLLRERARVAEVVSAEAARLAEAISTEEARREALTLAAKAASERATAYAEELAAVAAGAAASETAVKALRLEVTDLKTTISTLMDQLGGTHDRLAAFEAENRSLAAENTTLREDLAERERRLSGASDEIEALKRRDAVVRSSLSWKITRPVRVVQTRLKPKS